MTCITETWHCHRSGIEELGLDSKHVAVGVKRTTELSPLGLRHALKFETIACCDSFMPNIISSSVIKYISE